jgi:hypothetical protein
MYVIFWDVMPCGFCKNRRFGLRSTSIMVKKLMFHAVNRETATPSCFQLQQVCCASTAAQQMEEQRTRQEFLS